MTSAQAMHAPAQSGPDPYAYLPKVPSFQLATGLGPDASTAYLGFTIAGQTLARATLVCPTPASAA
jgi:hypothetical protein